ncbi:hypothetical protein FIV42_08750 [Persicimonas caeni]|uniref:Uncharacterized protein n=1 Tax=Persicimonas caeni TaxID=2292766 RepID=A0A4Y6PR77_PERCE|nr:hypothetical protein [Persicimonas caeni]QDG50816.1 hypothetical protein FIV42_08750 [Persicimonas caeni]QED32037.1 hypothetical protein FRD00_08745 [Persicimonas caeni]
MRIVPISEFFTSYKLPPSRVQWAARRAVEAAEDVGAPAPVVDTFDQLLQMTVDYTTAKRAWKAARNTKADPQLNVRDKKVDRSFSNFVSRTEMELEDHGPDSPRGQSAHNLLEGPLDVEVYSVTNATREEEEAMLSSIIAELEANHLPDIRTCGLEASFTVLKEDFAAFREAMSSQVDTEAAPTTEQLGQMEDEIEAKMIEAIHRVNGTWPTPGQADLEARSAVLGPFAIQNDRAAAFYKRNRGSGLLPDVDPQTGEDVVEDPVDDVTDPEPGE